MKREALRYYLEGIEFGRIERLLGISYTAVIYWVKKAGEKIKEIAFEERKAQKVNILKIDEVCINFKKLNQKWIWLAVERYSQKNKRFFLGARDNFVFENLSKRKH